MKKAIQYNKNCRQEHYSIMRYDALSVFLLLLFLSTNISAQIFQTNDNVIFIEKEALLIESSRDIIQKKDTQNPIIYIEGDALIYNKEIVFVNEKSQKQKERKVVILSSQKKQKKTQKSNLSHVSYLHSNKRIISEIPQSNNSAFFVSSFTNNPAITNHIPKILYNNINQISINKTLFHQFYISLYAFYLFKNADSDAISIRPPPFSKFILS